MNHEIRPFSCCYAERSAQKFTITEALFIVIILLCIENNKAKNLLPCFADFTRLQLFGNSTNVESAQNQIQNIFWQFFMIIFTHSLLDRKLKLHDEKI